MTNVKKNAGRSDNHLPQNMQSIEIKKTDEKWTECELVDGTVLRVKPVIMVVRKVPDVTDTDGNPVFVVKSTLVVDVQSAGKS